MLTKIIDVENYHKTNTLTFKSLQLIKITKKHTTAGTKQIPNMKNDMTNDDLPTEASSTPTAK